MNPFRRPAEPPVWLVSTPPDKFFGAKLPSRWMPFLFSTKNEVLRLILSSTICSDYFFHLPMADSPGQRPKVDSESRLMGFHLLHEDLLLNVLCRLPALSFAYAACVSKTWHRVCDRILSRPKLASALSVNPDGKRALQEVVNKVLSEPIRPHFAIANVDSDFRLKETLQFMTSKLGSKTPIIVSYNSGIIGRDVTNYALKEAKWGDVDIRASDEGMSVIEHGIVLTVGFVPGLRVDAIPLLRSREESSRLDKFIQEIREYSASNSGQSVPVGIIMFGDGDCDLQYVVEKLDYALPQETAIAGDQRCQFVYKNSDGSSSNYESQESSVDAVALTFARDRDDIPGQGKIKFHVALSEAVAPLGPIYKTASVKVSDRGTWLTARREVEREVLDGQRILNEINEQLENRVEFPELYVRVKKRRKYSIGSEKPGIMTSLSYHAVLGGDEEYLYLDGVGIKTGDQVQFYISDGAAALSSCGEVSASLKSLISGDSNDDQQTRGGGCKKEVFGGFVFSCCGRGESFFGRLNVDSSPIIDNFPGVPVAGIFCGGEIGRRTSSLIEQNQQEDSRVRCCSHVYSTVYLVMEYTSHPEQSCGCTFQQQHP